MGQGKEGKGEEEGKEERERGEVRATGKGREGRHCASSFCQSWLRA